MAPRPAISFSITGLPLLNISIKTDMLAPARACYHALTDFSLLIDDMLISLIFIFRPLLDAAVEHAISSPELTPSASFTWARRYSALTILI